MSMIGLIYKKKIFKNIGFCIFESNLQKTPLQLTFKNVSDIHDLKNYSYIKLIQYTEKKESIKYREYEVSKFELISEPVKTVPFELDKIHLLKTTTNYTNRVFALRSAYYRNILLKKHQMKQEIVRTLNKLNFISIESPKIINKGLETGGSEMFKINFYDSILYLTQSPQMYKQILVNVFDKVYEISTIFRAEKSDSPKHLAEINALDVEMVTENIDEVMDLLKLLIINVHSALNIPLGDNNFKVYTYEEIAKILSKTDNTDFTNKDLQELPFKCEIGDWYFIKGYPNNIRAFYTKGTNSFDLYYKDVEIASGSLRISDYNELVSKLESINAPVEEYAQYLDNFKYGSKPHGGLGLGLDRLIKVLLNIHTILDTNPFPRSYTNIV